MILIDSNVVVAAVHPAHLHHLASFALFQIEPPLALGLASHSVAEAYVTLTRRGGPAPIAYTSAVARGQIASVVAQTRIIGLSPTQTVEAVQDFSQFGIGARLYDFLIGRAGLVAGADSFVTLNLRHMRSLFPEVTVRSPEDYLRSLSDGD